MEHLGKILIVFGLLIAILGVGMLLIGKLPYIGKLPGDIVIKKDNFTFYFPLASSILISVILSLVLWLFSKK